MVKNYSLDDFIQDIAYASYGTTFLEVLANYLEDKIKEKGERAQVTVDPRYLDALKKIIPILKFRLGTTDDQRANDIKRQNELKKLEKQISSKLIPGKVKEIKKKIEVIQIDEKKENKDEAEQNYGVYPVSSAFSDYTELMDDLRNNADNVFQLNVYSITDNIKKKFLLDSGFDKLSTTISPDWIAPFKKDDKDLLDILGFWEYANDRNLKLSYKQIPFKGFRNGVKMIVLPKSDYEKFLKSKNINEEKDNPFNLTSSDKNVVVYIRNLDGKLTHDDYQKQGELEKLQLENSKITKLSEISPIKPQNIEEPFQNLFDDIEDFIKDYNEQEVKKTAGKINLIIPEKLDKQDASKQLWISTKFARQMMEIQLKKVEDKLIQQESEEQFKKFKELMEKFKNSNN